MVTVPASLPHAVTPAAGVTTNVPVMPVAVVLTFAEICTVLTALEGSTELSSKFSVVLVNAPVAVVFAPKHAEPRLKATLVPVTRPSGFCRTATKNDSAGVPVVVVNVAAQVPVMVGCAVAPPTVTVPPVGVVGAVGVPVGAVGVPVGAVGVLVGAVGVLVGVVGDVGIGDTGTVGSPPGVANGAVEGGVGVPFGVGAGVTFTLAPDGVVELDLTVPPQAASISINTSSQAEASFTLPPVPLGLC